MAVRHLHRGLPLLQIKLRTVSVLPPISIITFKAWHYFFPLGYIFVLDFMGIKPCLCRRPVPNGVARIMVTVELPSCLWPKRRRHWASPPLHACHASLMISLQLLVAFGMSFFMDWREVMRAVLTIVSRASGRVVFGAGSPVAVGTLALTTYAYANLTDLRRACSRPQPPRDISGTRAALVVVLQRRSMR